MELDALNSAQRQAVTASDGAHLVIAGAGTGKTQTLVHRVAWLIEQGVPPSAIVLLTFTRRAAREMLTRVEAMVGPAARGVRGGTFHSFAQATLRRHATKLGFPFNFTVLDRDDSEQLMQLVRVSRGLNSKKRRFPTKSTLVKIASQIINTGEDLPVVLENSWPDLIEDTDEIADCIAEFHARKRTSGLMDFDDLLVHLRSLLVEHEDALQSVSGSIQHLLVDEYQDVNRLQAELSSMLAVVHGNLMVVGDEAQSIYAFRGASVRHILDFREIYPQAHLTILSENYRSTQPVLDVANAILASSAETYDKRLKAALDPEGPRPWLVSTQDDGEMVQGVVRSVVVLAEQGFDLKNQAVLFRSATHANLLEIALAEAKIPYVKFGGIKFGEAAHIKDVLALLKLVVNPQDEIAWMRVLGWLPGVGEKTAGKWAGQLMAAQGHDVRALAPTTKPCGPGLVDLDNFFREALAHEHEPSAVLKAALVAYVPRLRERYDNATRRVRDFSALEVLADRAPNLTAMLADLALDPVEATEQERSEDDDVLTLSTIHSAKGLEWDVVQLISLSDGAFPSGYALDDPEGMEEERRLFYVAVTRARRRLYLWSPRFVYSGWGGGRGISQGCSLLHDIEPVSRLFDTPKPLSLRSSEAAQSRQRGQAEDARLARIRAYFGKTGAKLKDSGD